MLRAAQYVERGTGGGYGGLYSLPGGLYSAGDSLLPTRMYKCASRLPHVVFGSPPRFDTLPLHTLSFRTAPYPHSTL